tara:strand:+ start:2467 stop:2838 length:372 start_codon:yes stop_codon:yes gene_type:complete
MKALGIVAIVVAAISIVIPVFGATYLPIIAGIMAVIAVKEESTLAFVALGINIVNVAFLSASIRLADAACDVMSDFSAGMEELTGESYGSATCDGGGAFWTWMGINIALLAVAVGIQLMNKKA